MSQNQETPRTGSAAQRMFGSQAPVYAASQVHVSDDSLESIRRLAGDGSYSWTLDLGTGAGFTAFALAPQSQRVLATDLTRPMLEQTRRIGQERKIGNLALSQNRAEALPVASEAIDLVTCRVAGHHFTSLAAALDEVYRVLKPGGVLVMADTMAPEDDAVAAWMNDIELRRDFSHVRNRPESVIDAMLAERGMSVLQREYARVYLRFNEWVARTATPEQEVVSLRRDFHNASDAVREAFQIEEIGDDLSFSWPCLIFRAEKR
ncbi:MAG: class I SAM-dependent methyltransferase [Dehalococcoidia bacterium]